MLELLGLGVAVALHPELIDQYTVFKWTVLFAFCGALLIRLGIRARETVRVPAAVLLCFAGVLSAELPAHIASGFAFSASRAAEWLCLGGVILLVLQAHAPAGNGPRDSIGVARALAGAGLVVALYGFVQMAGIHLPGFWRNEFPASFFGFQNMTAECVGIAAVCSCWLFCSRPGRAAFVWLIISSVLVSYLWFLKSRAGYLGLALALPSLAFAQPPMRNVLKLAAAGSIVAACIAVTQWQLLGPAMMEPEMGQNPMASQSEAFDGSAVGATSSDTPTDTASAETAQPGKPSSKVLEHDPQQENLFANPDEMAQAKEQNSRTRIIRWRNTLSLIAENPLGIGPMRYAFGYLPYRSQFALDPEANEGWVPRSPHNAFLGALAESGWLYGAAWLVVAALFCFRAMVPALSTAWRSRALEQEFALFLALAAYLLADALVAFPSDNAFPFLTCGVTAALGIRVWLRHGPNARLVGVPRWCLLVAGAVLVLFAAAKHTADKTYARPHARVTEARFACDVMPEHLEVCLKAAESWLNAGRPAEALRIVENNLRRQPHHFPSRARAAELLTILGQREAACAEMKTYKTLLPESSRFDSTLSSRCL